MEDAEQNVVEDESDLDDIDISEEDFSTNDFVYCQYEEIKKSKGKHSCTFRDAIIHIAGVDYVSKRLVADIVHD